MKNRETLFTNNDYLIQGITHISPLGNSDHDIVTYLYCTSRPIYKCKKVACVASCVHACGRAGGASGVRGFVRSCVIQFDLDSFYTDCPHKPILE